MWFIYLQYNYMCVCVCVCVCVFIYIYDLTNMICWLSPAWSVVWIAGLGTALWIYRSEKEKNQIITEL